MTLSDALWDTILILLAGTIGRRADEQKPSFLAQARKNDELRAKSEAICSWWEEQGAKRQSDGQPPRICSMEPY